MSLNQACPASITHKHRARVTDDNIPSLTSSSNWCIDGLIGTPSAPWSASKPLGTNGRVLKAWPRELIPLNTG